MGLNPLTVARLQQSVGNTAVTLLLQRDTGIQSPAKPKGVTEVILTVGIDINKNLATAAKAAAAKGVDEKAVRALRIVALDKDQSIGDTERMFLAALMDPDNAKQVAKVNVQAGTVFKFPRASVQPHYNYIKDFDRQDLGPDVKALLAKADAVAAAVAANPGIADNPFVPPAFKSAAWFKNAAQVAAVKRINELATPAWAKKVAAVLAWAGKNGGNQPVEILEAMTAAASDSTAGDMVMAGAVYVVAASVGHSVTADLRAGRIKVDQLGKPVGGDSYASYVALGGGASKGDTISVPEDLDITMLTHRRAVIHELEHASDDKNVTPGKVQKRNRTAAEVRAYRAGASYELEQIAALPDPSPERDAAIRDVATAYHPIFILAAATECLRDLNRFEVIVSDINNSVPKAKRFPVDLLNKLFDSNQFVVEAILARAIRRKYGIVDKQEKEIPGRDVGAFDTLAGESAFDWIDRL